MKRTIHIVGLLGMGLSTLTLGGCGDPCLDDGAGTPGAVCDEVASASATGTETSTTETSTTDMETETGESETETGAMDETWCVDADMDGFGDPDNCEQVPEGETPPAGSVPEDQATDCADDDPNTFPGAAENDDPDACMTDADDDGWGEGMPSNPAAVAGTDCDDANADAFPGAAPNEVDPDGCYEDGDGDDWGNTDPMGGETLPGSDCDDADAEVLMCEVWCPDTDDDGFGAAEGCVPVIPGEEPPPNTVMDSSDCDDSDPNTFVGAAEIDDPEACMTDADNDGWGDDMPGDGVTPGRDCDDGDELQVICVEAPACIDTTQGVSTQLMASVTGGDGNYGFAWTPAETLDDPTIADPMATPENITTYTVLANDGNMPMNNVGSDQVTVHVTDRSWILGGVPEAECEGLGLLGNQPSARNFFDNGTRACTTTNSLPTVYICPIVHREARITGTIGVTNAVGDDDFIGFVWGWQNSNQFYILHWKASAVDNGPDCQAEVGMYVKKIDAQDAVVQADVSCGNDNENMQVLATPQDTYNQPWIQGVEYGVEIAYESTQTEITITNLNDDVELTSFVIMDDSYPQGQFGTYDASQPNACNGPWQSSCL